MSVRPTGYLSHQTALYLHGTTRSLPNPIYANAEQQGDGRNSSKLTQDSINSAYRRQPRISSNKADFGEWTICLISCKRAHEIGVIEASHPRHGLLRYTSIERTLIDATVRPYLAGGTNEVLRAFSETAHQVSIERLCDTLMDLDFAYPYHQAIGFYLERSDAFARDALHYLRQLPREFDFYLDSNVDDLAYSSQWRLFYPRKMDELSAVIPPARTPTSTICDDGFE